jgi:predicted MFS family arabinose efflux permease
LTAATAAAFLVGSAAGSALAGVLVDRADPAAAFLVGAAYSRPCFSYPISRQRAVGAR